MLEAAHKMEVQLYVYDLSKVRPVMALLLVFANYDIYRGLPDKWAMVISA